MNKTISQIAKELGVTRQAVWYKTKNQQLAEQIKKHSNVIGKTLCIDEEGEKLIKNSFIEVANENQPNPQYNNDEKIINLDKNIDYTPLKENLGKEYTDKQQMIDILNLQLTNVNKRNEELTHENQELKQNNKELREDYKELVEELRAERKHLLELTDKLAELASNAQKLHAGDIVVPKLEASVETVNKTKKNGIFNLFFKRKKENQSNE